MLILGLVLFVLLVIVHEWGHYLAARRHGVEVEEFGIGFPPMIIGWQFKAGGTFYSLNWLPLGGFVKLKGEHDADKTKGSYGAAPMGKKAIILMAGVMMNLLAAVVILTILSYSGMPRLVDGQFSLPSDTKITEQQVLVSFVAAGSPAEQAGLKAGDKLISLAGQPVASAVDLSPLAESLRGQSVALVYQSGSNNQTTTQTIKINSEGGSDGYLGVGSSDFIIERSTWSAPIRGIGLTAQFTWLTLEGLFSTLSDLANGQGADAAASVAGPVGIVVLLKDVSQAGLAFVLMFIALISVTLAVMNALPIPALDGGRLFVSLLYRALNKPLSAKTEERIHATGMAVLLGLVVLITVVDVQRFF